MSGSKVLIVEDEVIVAMSIERTLSTFGYDVVGLSTTPEDAIRIVGELSPDLVLMDINLECDTDGIDAAEKIAQMSEIPVVYLTSYTNEETLRRAIGTNPYGYLTKPVRPKELYTTIETVLNKRRAEIAERKLMESRRTQWEVINSIDLGLCICSYDPVNEKCPVSAINEKACKILGVSPGKEIWKNEVDLGRFIPGLADQMAEYLSAGRKRGFIEPKISEDPRQDGRYGYVLRIIGFENQYSAFITFLDMDEFNGKGAARQDSGTPDGKIFGERGKIDMIREITSSILNRCEGEGEFADEISAQVNQIEKILNNI